MRFDTTICESWRRGCLSTQNLVVSPLCGDKILTFPVREERFEIPLFLLNDLIKNPKRWLGNKTAVTWLKPFQMTGVYTTVEANVKFSFSIYFKQGCLKVQVPNSENYYYCTTGAVFNEEWDPLCMESWTVKVLKPDPDNGNVTRVLFLEPVFRIAPCVMLEKADTMQKFIVGKYMRVLLQNCVSSPAQYYSDYHVSVRFEDFPFFIGNSENPDINTSNENLVSILKKHQDELCK